MRTAFQLLLYTLLTVALTGCEDILNDSDESASSSTNTTATTATTDTGTDGSTDTGTTTGGTGSAQQVPADLAGVVWLHSNVSSWPETASLSVSIGGGSISLNYNKANVWPATQAGGTTVNANPWVFVFQGGTWYAATFEWLRPGQTSKPTATVSGSHIKKPPLNNFMPVSGKVYGFMVSGLARTSTRNVQERSNVVMATWP